MQTLRERMLKYTAPTPTPAGCLLWIASTNNSGYGQLNVGGRPRLAHRIAWELVNGPIPRAFTLERSCQIRECVNPSHMKLASPGTPRERIATHTRRAASGCLLWLGSKNENGYGVTTIHSKRVLAHRLSWELENGPIPEGLVIDHLCRVTSCVNPKHLRVVTSRVNVLAGEGACARNARKTTCPRGHELAGDNLEPGQARYGWRVCRTCAKATKRRYVERKKGCAA